MSTSANKQIRNAPNIMKQTSLKGVDILEMEKRV